MIELSDMVRELRQELNAAMADGDGDAIRFELGPVQLAATVAVNREAGTNGKVRFWVIDADASGRYAQSQTQQITLTLQPKAVAADGTLRTALIVGNEADGER